MDAWLVIFVLYMIFAWMMFVVFLKSYERENETTEHPPGNMIASFLMSLIWPVTITIMLVAVAVMLAKKR